MAATDLERSSSKARQAGETKGGERKDPAPRRGTYRSRINARREQEGPGEGRADRPTVGSRSGERSSAGQQSEKKHELIASAQVYGAGENSIEVEEKAEEEEEPGGQEPAWKVPTLAGNACSKIVESTRPDIEWPPGEVALGAENYLLTERDGEAANNRKRTGPYNYRPSHEAQHQVGEAQNKDNKGLN